MPRMTKYQLEHFEKKVKRRLNPLIEEQELLIKQYTTEAKAKPNSLRPNGPKRSIPQDNYPNGRYARPFLILDRLSHNK